MQRKKMPNGLYKDVILLQGNNYNTSCEYPYVEAGV